MPDHPADGPFVVHCFHGSDRTGAMIACYRMQHQGWTPERAFAEMTLDGFHPRSREAKRQFVFSVAAHLAGRSLTAGFARIGDEAPSLT